MLSHRTETNRPFRRVTETCRRKPQCLERTKSIFQCGVLIRVTNSILVPSTPIGEGIGIICIVIINTGPGLHKPSPTRDSVSAQQISWTCWVNTPYSVWRVWFMIKVYYLLTFITTVLLQMRFFNFWIKYTFF